MFEMVDYGHALVSKQPFYLHAILGGPSFGVPNRRRFKGVDETTAVSIGQLPHVKLDDMELMERVWVFTGRRDNDDAHTWKHPGWKPK